MTTPLSGPSRRLLAVIPSPGRIHVRRAGYDASLGDELLSVALVDLERRGLVQRQGDHDGVISLTTSGRAWRRMAA